MPLPSWQGRLNQRLGSPRPRTIEFLHLTTAPHGRPPRRTVPGGLLHTVAALRSHRTRQLEERRAAGPAWEDWDLIFPSTTRAPMDGTCLSVLFRRRMQRASRPARRHERPAIPVLPFHGLRHSAATLLLAQGLTLGEIQKVLGHAGIQATSDLYEHFAPEIAARGAGRMEAIVAAR